MKLAAALLGFGLVAGGVGALLGAYRLIDRSLRAPGEKR